jgi:uncharacterized protein YcsI (UPF0317 family)
MKTWSERIRQHATVHYTEDGWDILVECWTDEYLNEIIGCSKTYEEAVIACSDILSVMDGFRKEIQAEVY